MTLWHLSRAISSIKFCGQRSAARYSMKLSTNTKSSHSDKLPFLLSQANNPRLKNKIAFTEYTGNNFTFGELAVRSAGLAKELNQLVSGSKQERIAFLCDRDFSYLVTLSSIWWTQNVAIPLSAAHPDSMLEYFFKSTSTKLVITNANHADRLHRIAKSVGSEILVVNHKSSNSEDENILESRACLMDYGKDNGALILFTSGTTGKPKGVLLTHENLEAQVQNICGAWKISENDCMLHVLPLHHTHGIIHAMLSPLAGGARCHMLQKFDAKESWKELLSTHPNRPTLLTAVPTVFVKLIEEYENTFAKDVDKVSFVLKTCQEKMRVFLSGSASLPVPILKKFEALSGHRILERYGMTETGLILCSPLEGQRKPGFVGTPLETVQMMVADLSADSEERKKVLAKGDARKIEIKDMTTDGAGGSCKIVGDLLVKGPSVFREYWGNPEATKKEFTEDGWFITGDTVEYVDGSFKILGRKSIDIIKSGGYKLSAQEIEAQLLSLNEVKEVAIVGIQDPTWGQKVAAIIVWTRNELSVKELRDLAKTRLAPYACPSIIKTMNELPKNHLGKVNKKELVKMFS